MWALESPAQFLGPDACQTAIEADEPLAGVAAYKTATVPAEGAILAAHL